MGRALFEYNHVHYMSKSVEMSLGNEEEPNLSVSLKDHLNTANDPKWMDVGLDFQNLESV